MNTRAEIALEGFCERFDALLMRCDEFERSGRWDTEELGFMSAFIESDLMAAVLAMMSVDGVFETPETEVVNRMFDAEYTPQGLREMYGSLKPVIDDYVRSNASSALDVLRSCDPSLCDAYRSLILDACDVMSAADGIAESSEIDLVGRIREKLNA